MTEEEPGQSQDQNRAHAGQPPAENQSQIDTGGGAVIGGSVTFGPGGTFVGRDLVTEERAYDVRGLPNPYLGLRAFTYADRAAYAGRGQAVQNALERINSRQERHALWFISGASGSGKSSFVQAGLLPALEDHYRERQMGTRRAIFRPATSPLIGLADALAELRISEVQPSELQLMDPAKLVGFMAEKTPPEQINLLVIDQFEECFTQAGAQERDWLLACLTAFQDADLARTLVLVTLRSDYLSELFACEPLWQIAKRGIELRAMSGDELKEAIQGPLEARRQQANSQGDDRYRYVRFEEALLERLARDAGAESTYLPLLQVTLQHLWAGGSLKLERYGRLTDAIRQRAETVYAYRDFDSSQPVQERPVEERAEIISLFLDLVSVSLVDAPRPGAAHDVRHSREKADLEKEQPLRRRLVEELAAARLLSVSVAAAPITARAGQPSQRVDIIHESLLANWPRLVQAVAERREQLSRRKRFESLLQDWLGNQRSAAYLLSGIHLAEARELAAAGDIALQARDGKEFLQHSLERAETETERQLALERRARVGLQVLAAVLGVLLLASLAWISYPFLLSLSARGELAAIPAGVAVVGPDPSYAAPRGTQQFSFDLPAYQIERFEVTNRQYGLCVQARRCSEPSLPLDPQRPDYPVTSVTALQADAYCRWIGRRLPTEIEWERAARGAQGWLWPWGNDDPTPERANLNFNGEAVLMPVGSYPDGCSPAPERVCDLIGNAAEWTASLDPGTENAYQPLDRWSGEEPGAEDSRFLIYRGSYYGDDLSEHRPGTSLAAQSSLSPPYESYEWVGFRCSR